MVKVVIGNKLCSFEELLEEYWKICKENEALRKEIFGSASEMDKFFEENISLKKQIAELESELSVKEDLVKIKNALYEEEPLPFSDEQYEEEPKLELPTMPIDVASMLINAKLEYKTPELMKVFGAGETSFADKYSKSDLREIAKHLLIFCNNPDEDDDTQS